MNESKLNLLILQICLTMIGMSETTSITMSSPMPNFVTATESTGVRNKTIRIITTITYDNDYFPIGSLGTEATRLALNKLALQPDWLPGYNVELEMIDDYCLDEGAIHPLIEKLRNSENEARFPIVLLSECEAKAELIPASFLKDFNFIGHSIYENTIKLSKRRHKLPNYLGLGQRADYYFFGLIAFCKEMGWSRVALVSEIDPYYDLVSSIIP